MKEIKLTKGQVTLVDDDDFDWLNQWSWYADKIGGTFYVKRRIYLGRINGKGRGRSIYIHREIMQPSKGKRIDHKDGDGLNNQKHNLRECTHTENMRNAKSRRVFSSKYHGVHWDKAREKWSVTIMADRKLFYIGRFNDENQAALAFNEAAKKHHGEFASLNILK